MRIIDLKQETQSPNCTDSKYLGHKQSSEVRPRVLVIAYSCDPEGGSEAGVGWGLLREVSKFANCVVLVSSLYMPMIENWKKNHPNDFIKFVGVPEPKLRRFSHKHRIVWFTVYALWLDKATSMGKRLHEEYAFDLIFHATVTPYWLPSPLTKFNVPSVWGPVGGAVTSHIPLWPILGAKGLVDELFDFVSVRLASWMPATRRTWKNGLFGNLRGARLRILSQKNKSVRQSLRNWEMRDLADF